MARSTATWPSVSGAGGVADAGWSGVLRNIEQPAMKIPASAASAATRTLMNELQSAPPDDAGRHRAWVASMRDCRTPNGACDRRRAPL